jgi:hypothetical protein
MEVAVTQAIRLGHRGETVQQDVPPRCGQTFRPPDVCRQPSLQAGELRSGVGVNARLQSRHLR